MSRRHACAICGTKADKGQTVDHLMGRGWMVLGSAKGGRRRAAPPVICPICSGSADAITSETGR